MLSLHRRNFLKLSGLTVLPGIMPAQFFQATRSNGFLPGEPVVKFFYDGDILDPAGYLTELQKILDRAAFKQDYYGQGGVVAALEKKFEEVTGKEKAIFMPSGTMANQLAIAVLSAEKTKVFVQDNSHVYRDEADAAQSVFQKRLMPLAKTGAYFTADQLQKAVAALDSEEVFKSGIGAVSIENPVRRADGKMVPLEEIKAISAWCRSQDISLHLDGARIHMAAAWSGIPVKEYASHFDTVYISLYKYLGASAGAILCGDKKVIDKMPHLIKIHGGNMFGNWLNAAMALDRLNNIDERLGQAKQRAEILFAALNKMTGLTVSHIPGGTNIYLFSIAREVDARKLQQELNTRYNIRIAPPANNQLRLTVNDTILLRDTTYLVEAFRSSLRHASS